MWSCVDSRKQNRGGGSRTQTLLPRWPSAPAGHAYSRSVSLTSPERLSKEDQTTTSLCLCPRGGGRAVSTKPWSWERPVRSPSRPVHHYTCQGEAGGTAGAGGRPRRNTRKLRKDRVVRGGKTQRNTPHWKSTSLPASKARLISSPPLDLGRCR